MDAMNAMNECDRMSEGRKGWVYDLNAVNEWMDERMKECNGPMNAWMHEWVNEWIQWMNTMTECGIGHECR